MKTPTVLYNIHTALESSKTPGRFYPRVLIHSAKTLEKAIEYVKDYQDRFTNKLIIIETTTTEKRINYT